LIYSENNESDEFSAHNVMVPGVSFTIEPILKVGSTDFKMWKDKWAIESVDKFVSAQFEHTLLILEDGVEILTAFEGEQKIFKNKKI
jgi:methionyl aminopeptidase